MDNITISIVGYTDKSFKSCVLGARPAHCYQLSHRFPGCGGFSGRAAGNALQCHLRGNLVSACLPALLPSVRINYYNFQRMGWDWQGDLCVMSWLPVSVKKTIKP